MGVFQGELTQEQFNNLRLSLGDKSRALFHTDAKDNNTWRQLLAFDPCSTFILDDIENVSKLHTFVEENQQSLCAGYLSYDLGIKLRGISPKHKAREPLAIFHAYESWVEVINGNIHVFSPNKDYLNRLNHLARVSQNFAENTEPLKFTTTIQKAPYKFGIEKIHGYIRAGDFYQINYTQQLLGKSTQSAHLLYDHLLQNHPAEYACYFEAPEFTIQSLSPELFLHYSEGRLTTKPIKGTRPRGGTDTEDNQFKQALLNSQKEQAELYMITDLMRNDLGQVCEIGSVTLDAIKSLNKLPKVWHTYSHISGNIKSDIQPIDALLSMFPGGSITGCPKRRAMEVIDEMEISPRGVYTGSIGYFHPDGDFSFNIAIRTLIQRGSKLSLGSGGGITIDSKWQDEWDELLVKVSTFE